MKLIKLIALMMITFLGCVQAQNLSSQRSFNSEIELLSHHYSPIILSRGEQKVMVLAELQGRVMTSTSKGGEDKGYGWINYDYLSKPHTNVNASMGGADRLWFGPDASKFSLFFEPNTATIPDNIKVPAAVSTVPFNVISKTDEQVVMAKALTMKNYQGFNFEFDVERTIELLSSAKLPIALPDSLTWVAFKASTKVTNTSSLAWTKATGLFSIWDLGSFYPNEQTTIFIPLAKPLAKATRYFSDIKTSHTRIQGNVLFYKADARYMNKTGVSPEHAKPMFGSYDAKRKLLTLIHFPITKQTNVDYVNGIWRFDGDPFGGEIINIFNHGVGEDESTSGPFYELETSSIALELKPNESYQHYQTTLHIQGDESALNLITQQVFGLTLAEITSAF